MISSRYGRHPPTLPAESGEIFTTVIQHPAPRQQTNIRSPRDPAIGARGRGLRGRKNAARGIFVRSGFKISSHLVYLVERPLVWSVIRSFIAIHIPRHLANWSWGFFLWSCVSQLSGLPVSFLSLPSTYSSTYSPSLLYPTPPNQQTTDSAARSPVHPSTPSPAMTVTETPLPTPITIGVLGSSPLPSRPLPKSTHN